MFKKLAVKLVYLFLIVNILFVEQSFAYIDPGSGSLILQIILGAIAATAAFAKIFWYRVKEFFKKFSNLFTKKDENQ